MCTAKCWEKNKGAAARQPKFKVGETAYSSQTNGQVSGQTRYQYMPNIIKDVRSCDSGRCGYSYILENDPFNHESPEASLLTYAEVALKVKQDKLLYQIIS